MRRIVRGTLTAHTRYYCCLYLCVYIEVAGFGLATACDAPSVDRTEKDGLFVCCEKPPGPVSCFFEECFLLPVNAVFFSVSVLHTRVTRRSRTMVLLFEIAWGVKNRACQLLCVCVLVRAHCAPLSFAPLASARPLETRTVSWLPVLPTWRGKTCRQTSVCFLYAVLLAAVCSSCADSRLPPRCRRCLWWGRRGKWEGLS